MPECGLPAVDRKLAEDCSDWADFA